MDAMKGQYLLDRFFCLFGVFRPTREFFTRLESENHCLLMPQILTNARHLLSLNDKGSLACRTYCGTGHSFKLVISDDP